MESLGKFLKQYLKEFGEKSLNEFLIQFTLRFSLAFIPEEHCVKFLKESIKAFKKNHTDPWMKQKKSVPNVILNFDSLRETRGYGVIWISLKDQFVRHYILKSSQ